MLYILVCVVYVISDIYQMSEKTFKPLKSWMRTVGVAGNVGNAFDKVDHGALLHRSLAPATSDSICCNWRF